MGDPSSPEKQPPKGMNRDDDNDMKIDDSNNPFMGDNMERFRMMKAYFDEQIKM